MSCFIMNPESVARIANFIAYHINFGTNLTAKLPESFIKAVTRHGEARADEVYRHMFETNYAAYNKRYGEAHKPQGDLKDQYAMYDNSIHHSPGNTWKYQMLKSMECWMYQCSESEELETCDTFVAVKRLAEALKNNIIHTTPEYITADWD